MKKVFISIMALLLASQAIAQVAHWAIHPDYDSIYFASGANLIITDSLDIKTVWTLEGRRLFKTEDHLCHFSEGYAVTTKKNSDIITGFYDVNGRFTTLEKDCYVAHNYPYFSDGYLLVKKDDKFYFVSTDGQLKTHGFVLAYPFHHGYASCRDYKNPEKPKERDLYNFLISNKDKGRPLSFSFNGRPFSSDDLEFVSSINDEGVGVVVAKHKVFFYKEKEELEPVSAPEEEKNLKNQAKLNGELPSIGSSNYMLYATCGKTPVQISIQFDETMIPLEINYNTEKYTYKKHTANREKKTSFLVITEKDRMYGLAINNVGVLPPQFEAIYECFGNDVFVKMSGKQGLLRVNPNEKFFPVINGGKEICFRHRTVDTKVRIEMPAFVPSNHTFIESCDTSFKIIKSSFVANNAPQGNCIEYDCELHFPSVLYEHIVKDPNNSKQETIPIKYPIQIVSEGIKFPSRFEAKVWYLKNNTINIDKSEKTVNKGVGTFTFDVERITEDDIYPLKVDIIADSLYPEPECEQSLSNNHRYTGKVYDLKEGPNDIIIKIEEEGCPPILHPYRLIYTKPSAKNKHKKEDIDIMKKTEEDELEFRY